MAIEMPKIILKNGPESGRWFPVGRETISIGRDPEREIPIGDKKASDLHAEIIPVEGGRFVIRDLGSAAGTILNGVAVAEHDLAIGDEIRIGSTVLLFAGGEEFDEESIDDPDDEDGPPTRTFKLPVRMEQADFLKTEDRDERKIRAAHRKLSTLYRISQEINSIRDLPALLQRTLDLTVEAVRAEHGCILVEGPDGTLVPEVVREPEGSKARTAAVSRTMAMEALKEGKAILTSDASSDVRYEGKDSISAHRIRSAMCAPLKTPIGTYGVVSLCRTTPLSTFAEADLELLVVLCNQAAVSIENARLFADVKRTNRLLLMAKDEIVRWTRELEVKVEERTAQLRAKSEQLKLLSITDGMTGLFNHQHFQNELRREVNRMLRYRGEGGDKTFALAMIDLDNLKEVNDTLGHLAGDGVLKLVAGVLRDNLRTVDLAARYGGDEFAILLPETDRAGALIALRKLSGRVREIEVTASDLLGETSPGQVGREEKRKGKTPDASERVPITISIGMTVYSRPQEPRDVIQQADEALYRAKAAGRDRIEVGEPGG